MTNDETFNPNLDPYLGQATWYRFTLPNGQEIVRPANDVEDADWHGASEVDVFREATWKPMHDGGWVLFGTKANGQRLPIDVIEGTHEPDLGDVECDPLPIKGMRWDSPDDIVRVTFESGRQVVIPAYQYAEIVRTEERMAWVDLFTPQEWVDEGNLPL